ncbi:Coenzyme F420 hydrogenase/dehydrogenase, beta subunit C-terminal domain [Segatella bryantii]|uniref:Coenzyme F420 hydrogenase/dehydrogenase, beta subunit C-terminal domain n=1 Tax=Segatella bryantii TaxID=77095 RepID=UPI00247921C1|nr:Coenzyme F420 hydrogenase/dehydrogenase, beta subunit C-terminal domain [Segatella bryantii]
MIEIKDKKDCCGCWACSNICPKQCIQMEEDREGFKYPKVDATLCIDCGLCEKVCPVLHADIADKPRQQVGFLSQHKDDGIRRESTSGGVFSAIAACVIRQGGVVFGAGYRKGTFVVEHQAVDRVENLGVFRNSKYVQSNVGDCYRQALGYLKKDRLVLFSGTPCQIEGFCAFLRGKIYKNLVLVDLVCRGIPSPRVLNSYITAQQQLIGGEFTNILFRDKYYSYQYSSFSIYNRIEKKNYHKGIDSNAYLRAFFNNLSDRPSCYNCRFKKRYRKSDLTLWDCFPIEKFTRELDGKGTTRVLVQSKKGEDLIRKASADLRVVEIEADKLVEGVREMFHSVPMNPLRDQFYSDLNEMHPVQFFQKWFPLTWKVRLNAFVRITCYRLGIYDLAKRYFMLFYKRKDERILASQIRRS